MLEGEGTIAPNIIAPNSSPKGIGMYHPQSSYGHFTNLPIHPDERHHLVEQVSGIQLQLVPATPLQHGAVRKHRDRALEGVAIWLQATPTRLLRTSVKLASWWREGLCRTGR